MFVFRLDQFFRFGVWKDASSEEMCLRTRALKRKAMALASSSKSPSTIAKYSGCWNKFVEWCTSNGFENYLPATPSLVGYFFAEKSCFYRSISTLNSYVYGIRWAHEFCGFADPTKGALPKTVIEGAKRKVLPRKNPKDYVVSATLLEICLKFATPTSSIRDYRFSALATLAFSGFFRISEVLNLRRFDITFFRSYFIIKIRSSKTDQYHEGKSTYISEGCTAACPRKILLQYLGMAGLLGIDDESYIFRRLVLVDKVYQLAPVNCRLTYKSARKELRLYMHCLGYEPSRFSWHSFRHGGATGAANAGVSERLFKKHGRWRSETAKDGYVHESLEQLLGVTKMLNL